MEVCWWWLPLCTLCHFFTALIIDQNYSIFYFHGCVIFFQLKCISFILKFQSLMLKLSYFEAKINLNYSLQFSDVQTKMENDICIQNVEFRIHKISLVSRFILIHMHAFRNPDGTCSRIMIYDDNKEIRRLPKNENCSSEVITSHIKSFIPVAVNKTNLTRIHDLTFNTVAPILDRHHPPSVEIGVWDAKFSNFHFMNLEHVHDEKIFLPHTRRGKKISF